VPIIHSTEGSVEYYVTDALTKFRDEEYFKNFDGTAMLPYINTSQSMQTARTLIHTSMGLYQHMWRRGHTSEMLQRAANASTRQLQAENARIAAEKAQLEAELEVLRARMNPMLLYAAQ